MKLRRGLAWRGAARRGPAGPGSARLGEAGIYLTANGGADMSRMTLEELKIDDSIYPRTRVSGFNVQRMISALEAGLKLPPIVIEAEANRIVDGRHRYEAYSQQGLKTIDVTKKSYASEADIYADAVRLNTGHGEPLDQFSIRNA